MVLTTKGPNFAIYMVPALRGTKLQKCGAFHKSVKCAVIMILTPKGPNYAIYMMATTIFEKYAPKGSKYALYMVPTQKG